MTTIDGGLGARSDVKQTVSPVAYTGLLARASVPTVGSALDAVPPKSIAECLDDAELLMGYAAEVGIPVGDDVRRSVLNARSVGAACLDEEQSVKLWGALTMLSASVKPASAESLRKCAQDSEASRTIKLYRTVAMYLGIVILPYSCAAFVATNTCEAIRKDIETANALAVTLYTARSVGSESEGTNREIQELASTLRDIDTRAAQLNVFILNEVADPYRDDRANPEKMRGHLELRVDGAPLSSQTTHMIQEYQVVRHFAQTVREWVSMTFGAMTSSALPVLYALLGACAFLLRSFEKQLRTRSFTGHDRPAARFVVAGIGGFVVGLFGDFGGGHASLSPLAIAFLVGYAADVFFYFLDSLLQAFGRPRADVGSGSQAPSAGDGTRPASAPSLS